MVTRDKNPIRKRTGMNRILRVPAKIVIQLLEHQIVKLFGEGVAQTVAKEVVDATGGEVLANVERWLDAPDTERQLERIVAQGETLFRELQMTNPRSEKLREILLAVDPVVEETVRELADDADENALRTALISGLRQQDLDASDSEVEEVVDNYLYCLRLSMLPWKEKTPEVVGRAVMRIERSLGHLSTDVAEVQKMMRELLSTWKAQASQRTAEAMIDYSAYIADKTRGFTGREFVFSALRRFLVPQGSGYLLIRGDPGIGKTALMAELVRRHRYPHHFNIAAEGITRDRQFLGNSCAQLIARYELADVTLPEDAELDVDVLRRILTAATAKAEGEPVVLLVDALDETTDETVRKNPLLLPYSLSDGVRIIATTRRTARELEIEAASVEVLELVAGNDDNLADVRAYITEFARRPMMVAALRSSAISLAAFVETLEQRSEGNFMYLRHVLPALEAGEFGSLSALKFEALPQGLRGYYERHWKKMRGDNPERFVNVFQRVISVLATARQPVSLALIARATKLDFAQVVWTVECWHEFMRETKSEQGSLFSMYHTSYRDFLAEKVLAS